jgi:hypothetical protein
MITIMSYPPAVLQGAVEQPVTPTRLAAPSASPAHKFFALVHDLVERAQFHTEQQKLDAHSTIDGYERQVIAAGDLRQVTSDNDRAPYEDVRQRVAPGGVLPSAVLPAGIDYDQLAAAMHRIAAANAAQQAAAPPAYQPAQQPPVFVPAGQ